MRPATFHDLMMASAVIVGSCCLVIVLQIIIITKATIPADVMLTDLRVLRGEITREASIISQRLSNIESFVVAHAEMARDRNGESVIPQVHARSIEETLRSAEGIGLGRN